MRSASGAAPSCRELSQWALSQQKGPPGAPNREFPRAALRLKVQLIDGTRAVESESRSLSVGGLSVTAPIAPEVGQTMVLRLSPVAPDPQVMVTGVVVWYDRDRLMVGLRFGDLSDEARALLERLVFTNLLDKG